MPENWYTLLGVAISSQKGVLGKLQPSNYTPRGAHDTLFRGRIKYTPLEGVVGTPFWGLVGTPFRLWNGA